MRRLTLAVLVAALLPVTAFAEKPRLAVVDFKNDTSAAWWYGGAGRDLASMLTNELASDEKFRLVEREKLNAVLEEQDLGSSGRVNQKTAAKMGKMTGAQYIVTGTVSSYEQNTEGGGGGLSFHGIGIGGKKDEAYIAIDIRVVDTTTGEVVHTRTIEARSTSYGMAVGASRGGFSGGLSKYSNTPAGKAIRACLIEISEYLGCVMVDQNDCMNEYSAKEKARRDKTKKAIKIE
jgi:curli biogenesis system outer membrane secretion channel CsgG